MRLKTDDGEESVVLSQLQAEKQAAADAGDEKNPDAAAVEEFSLRESRVAAFQAYVRTSYKKKQQRLHARFGEHAK